MDQKDAVYLTNWFPSTTECMLRKGYSNYSTGLPGQVETLFSYAGGAVTKLFGVSNGSIYDCTAGGAVGAAAVSGLSNSRFQYINNATSGGNFLMAVNGADKMRYYDGTTWTADGGTFAVTVADTSNWSGITLHKQRVWAIQKNTLKAWYLPVSAIQGAAVAFDLSQFFKLGGFLVAVETWTIDGGFGVDDLLVFVSSRGEVLVYRGTDPSAAATWAMVGLWRIGAPVGARCLYKFAGDLLIICQDGIYPLSGALQSSRVQPQVALSEKIQQAASSAISNYGGTFGWQIINFPKENQIIVNVPVAVGSQQQYAMNTITKAWCNYTGWNANCWELYADDPFFGGNTIVGRAWNGMSDAGANIQAAGLQAWATVGNPLVLKRFTMSKPVFRSTGTPSVSAGLNVDYSDIDNSAALSFSPTSGSGTFGSATWGSSLWATSNLSIYNPWQGVSGVGYACAPLVKVASQGIDLRWVATGIVYEVGGIL